MTFSVGVVPVVAGDEIPSAHANWLGNVIDAHPAWSIVDNYIVSANRYVALKCDKSFSGLPKDFYVILRGPVISSSSYVFWLVAEDYDPTTHSVRRMPLQFDSTTPRLLTSDGTFTGDTWTPINGSYASPALNIPWAYISATYAVANQEYAVSVQNDCIVITARTRAPSFMGKFTSAVSSPSVNDPMPLVQFVSTLDNTTASLQGDYTIRHPFKGGQLIPHPGAIQPIQQTNLLPWVVLNGAYIGRSDGGSGDLFQNGYTPMYVPNLYQYVVGNANSNYRTHGLLRGTIPQLRLAQLAATSGGYLDTMVADGATWVFLGSNIWVNQEA